MVEGMREGSNQDSFLEEVPGLLGFLTAIGISHQAIAPKGNIEKGELQKEGVQVSQLWHR